MKASEALIARREAVVPRAVRQFADGVTAVSARGAVIIDADGRELIDLAGGIGVMNAGHGQESVVRAIQEQAAQLVHAGIHVATYEGYVALSEKLASLFPLGDHTKVVLLNSGAEAIENAVKIARQATGRSAILCYTHAFHGRTLLGMSLTSKTAYKVGCGPFAPEVYRIPYPDRYRYGDGLSVEEFTARELRRVHQAFSSLIDSTQIAAVLIEPVLGEGGCAPAPEAYIRGLREITKAHGILLICDEIQSGFGRVGAFAAYQRYGIVPDLATFAKSMGGGLPISAVVGRAEVMDAARPGTIGGTYGGNPLACAAALATIRVIEDQDLCGRAEIIGGRIRARLLDLKTRCSLVGDVRGMGAMVGMELSIDGDAKSPAKGVAASVVRRCFDEGVLILSAGTYANVIRILSPLVIADDELDRALDVIDRSVIAASREELP